MEGGCSLSDQDPSPGWLQGRKSRVTAGRRGSNGVPSPSSFSENGWSVLLTLRALRSPVCPHVRELTRRFSVVGGRWRHNGLACRDWRSTRHTGIAGGRPGLGCRSGTARPEMPLGLRSAAGCVRTAPAALIRGERTVGACSASVTSDGAGGSDRNLQGCPRSCRESGVPGGPWEAVAWRAVALRTVHPVSLGTCPASSASARRRFPRPARGQVWGPATPRRGVETAARPARRELPRPSTPRCRSWALSEGNGGAMQTAGRRDEPGCCLRHETPGTA